MDRFFNLPHILIISIWALLTACHSPSPKFSRNRSDEISDSCTVNGIHRYKVFIPSVDTKCDAMPLLLIIDPHGAATQALHRFIDGAEKYKFILVASATLKNNYPDFARAINILIADVQKKYPVNKSVFIAGFSGGARMALSYAQYLQVNGIIACGALAPPEQLEAIKCPVIALTGMADFNFVEAAQYILRPTESPKNLRLEVTEDIHGWPSSTILSSAMGYLHVAQKEVNDCCRGKAVFRNFAASEKARIDSFRLAGDFIGAGLIARNLASLEDFSKYDDFISIRNSIEYSTDFNSALEELKESIRFELQVRTAYYSALESRDVAWWVNEVSALNKKIASHNTFFTEMAYKRIKGFLGIMCYSLCNNTLQSNDIKNTSRLLAIYKMIEPGNADMFYDYALYFRKTNVPDSSVFYLKKAINAGYSDKQKMMESFPEELVNGLLPDQD